MCQSCDDHKQHANSNDRRTTKTGEGLLGIEDTRDKEYTNSTEEHQIGTYLGKQHHAEHTQYRDNGDPGV